MFNLHFRMDLEHLCTLLGDVPVDQLHAGFSSLLSLFPDSSCESLQMVNVLVPLLLDAIRPFFSEAAMIQVNCYFYVEVSLEFGFMLDFTYIFFSS